MPFLLCVSNTSPCCFIRKMSSSHDEAKSFARRDFLLKIQRDVQKLWEENKVFEANSGDKPPSPGEKFFGNFTYPYMNGLLHLGHAFTLSKLEFGAAYNRLCGSNVLLPFAFHCTGMPIKASADKLAREMQQYGNPPVFPVHRDSKTDKENDSNNSCSTATSAPNNYKSKRYKAVAKSGSHKSQWEIMRSFDLSDEEIAKFQDPYHWLSYFPPLAMKDLKAFGLSCDWRRSFMLDNYTCSCLLFPCLVVVVALACTQSRLPLQCWAANTIVYSSSCSWQHDSSS